MKKAVQEKAAEAVQEKESPKKQPAPKKPILRKKAAKAAPAKSEEIYVQFGSGEWRTDDLVRQVKEDYAAQGHRPAGIRRLALYIKPEERRAYYVINEKVSGSVEL